MNTYTYKDVSENEQPNWLVKTVFVCQANNILEADLQFKNVTGKEPTKGNITCHIEFTVQKASGEMHERT